MTPPRATGRDHVGLAELRRKQHDILTRAQLTGLGFRRDHVRDRIAMREWQAIGPRVVALTAGPISLLQRCWAAVLHAGPKAALAGFTALELHGLDGWAREVVHVVVPAGTHVAPMPGLCVHRSHRLAPSDVVERDGLVLTTAARSALDAARWDRSSRTAEALMIAVVQQRTSTPADLEDALRRFSKVKQKIAIVDGVDEARHGADSKAEAEVAELLERAGFPRPSRQVQISTSAGRRRVDLAVDIGGGRLLVVEVDGPRHEDADVRLIDAVKDAALIAAGHYVLRVPASAVREHPERLLREFQELAKRLL
jgi:hypothetical protein